MSNKNIAVLPNSVQAFVEVIFIFCPNQNFFVKRGQRLSRFSICHINNKFSHRWDLSKNILLFCWLHVLNHILSLINEHIGRVHTIISSRVVKNKKRCVFVRSVYLQLKLKLYINLFDKHEWQINFVWFLGLFLKCSLLKYKVQNKYALISRWLKWSFILYKHKLYPFPYGSVYISYYCPRYTTPRDFFSDVYNIIDKFVFELLFISDHSPTFHTTWQLLSIHFIQYYYFLRTSWH